MIQSIELMMNRMKYYLSKNYSECNSIQRNSNHLAIVHMPSWNQAESDLLVVVIIYDIVIIV